MKEHHAPERQGGNDPQRSSSSSSDSSATLLLPSWNETSPLAINYRSYGDINSNTNIKNYNHANPPKEFSMLHPEKRSWSMIHHPPDSPKFSMLHAEKRSWSMIHGEYSALRSPESSRMLDHHRDRDRDHDHDPPLLGKGGSVGVTTTTPIHPNKTGWVQELAYSTVFALVNVIIGLPCLYGYATVIFQHPVFVPYWSAISKLIIVSSLIFQLTFTCGSALPFVIGAVQDSGLVYLSHMATTIAVLILQEDHTNAVDDDDFVADDDDDVGRKTSQATAAVVLSTALVLLSLGTAVLGAIMILLGHFRLAEYIRLLPMPVVAAYLGFIGFYCFQAGVSLAISHNLATIFDWVYLVQKPDALLLALPALMTGLVFVALSRYTTSDAALPFGMIAILALFYIILGISGTSLEDAREANWVGDVAPPVPVTELFSLVDFSLVRWDLVRSIFPMWVGLAFVVSFGSCLDITAIFVDMGESNIDINRELSTIGLGNMLSGLCLGYTGSYIFSQSIFTYRTGFHSRWTGAIVVLVFAYVIASPVNILQVTPLFFLGSTLIFIGYDLMLEWLYDVRSKCRPAEYAIVWITFFIMPVAGVNAGIGIGAILSVGEHKLHSRRTFER